MEKQYNLAVVIGRFQPFHLGHKSLVDHAFSQADNVLVIIGSSNQPSTIKNPFSFKEREDIIRDAMHIESNPGHRTLYFAPVEDFLYEENKWIRKVQEAIDNIISRCHIDRHNKVCIVGHDKDESTYYLKSFPTYKFSDAGKYIEVGQRPIDSTQIRELLFNDQVHFLKGVLPKSTYETVINFYNTDKFGTLRAEYNFITDYKKQWAIAPYPVTFNTVDGVILQGGHILLIKRKSAPGYGLWALPGGFLDQNETHEDSMIRELREETRLKVPVPIIRANITHRQVFDHPDRSLRGRTITNAFLVELPGPEDGKLPRVKGADDAQEAKWFPIHVALGMGDILFEDHHSIISGLTARAK